MKLSEELTWRGFDAKTTIRDLASLDSSPRNFYWGTDPSADSLHIGHLAALMMCACFVRHGHRPFFLVGGATGQIGDPKDNAERELKPLSEIEYNKHALAQQIIRVTNSSPDTKILDNFDWFKDIKLLPFLREIGKTFSMTQLLDRQFVQARIGEGGCGISYAEFSYTLIQGYDFLHLFRQHDVTLQLCGADQFGNCASGIHLIRRLEGVTADAYACPLILDPSTGRKFGKSEGNAIWLDPAKTSIFDFYQFWINQPDQNLQPFFKYFTTILPEELSDLLAEHFTHPEKRLAQARLAREVTSIVHGVASADSAERLTSILFGDGEVSAVQGSEIPQISTMLPCAKLGTSLIDILVSTQLTSSKSEARKLISSGAISVNRQKVSSDAIISTPSVIKKGKNKFALVIE